MQESGWKAPPQWNSALEAHFCVGVQKCAGKEHKAPENQFVAALFPPGLVSSWRRRRGCRGGRAVLKKPAAVQTAESIQRFVIYLYLTS